MGRLDGKVAVITGAGSGIGRAASALFAHEGAKVVCADVSGREEVVAESIGDAALAVHVDVSVSADVARMIDTAETRFGRLDVLFNNAGFGGPRHRLADLPDETFDSVLAVKLKGVFYGMKYAIPAMLRSGGGSVINTASAAGLVGWKHLAAYCAAKGGVVQITKVAAPRLRHRRGESECDVSGDDLDRARRRRGRPPPPTDQVTPQPMKRWGMPTELAAAALFLASDESSFITGAAIPVDGGYVAR